MKTAIITGASRGIGESIARKLATLGYHLLLVAKNSKDSLESLKRDLEKSGISVYLFLGDMGKYEDVERMFQTLPFAHLDVLINNAGIAYFGLLQDMSITEWQEVINTNLSSVFYTSKLAIPYFLKTHKGHIINISSIWGQKGASFEVAYSASKGGMDAFTKALAKELAPSNILVNAVSCGAINTDMNAHLSKEDKTAITDEIPLGRFGNANEIASLVAYLCEENTYITGKVLGIDGGWD